MTQHDPSTAVACRQFEEDLVLYYYGELVGSERTAVEVHVRSCQPCRLYLKELESILPLMVTPDEPPPAFWNDYSREMRRKLGEASATKSWWSLGFFFQPWAIPASATAIVAVVALAFTFGKGYWSANELTQEDAAVVEILPMAENLEFFKTMEVLDAMDLLENMGGPAKSST